MNCECNCGNEAQCELLIIGDKLYNLCMNCHLSITTYSLSPAQFFALLKHGHTTKEFLLHSDFYDEQTGEALQPAGG